MFRLCLESGDSNYNIGRILIGYHKKILLSFHKLYNMNDINQDYEFSNNKNHSMLLFCHILHARTFIISKYYFPIYSICTGLYIGAFSFFIYVYYNYIEYIFPLILIALTMIILAFLDGNTQFGLKKSMKIQFYVKYCAKCLSFVRNLDDQLKN